MKKPDEKCDQCGKALEGAYEKSFGHCMGCVKKNTDAASAKAIKDWAKR